LQKIVEILLKYSRANQKLKQKATTTHGIKKNLVKLSGYIHPKLWQFFDHLVYLTCLFVQNVQKTKEKDLKNTLAEEVGCSRFTNSFFFYLS
jgi:hypothetical protein